MMSEHNPYDDEEDFWITEEVGSQTVPEDADNDFELTAAQIRIDAIKRLDEALKNRNLVTVSLNFEYKTRDPDGYNNYVNNEYTVTSG